MSEFKKGDSVFIEATVKYIDSEGDIWVDADTVLSNACFEPSRVHLAMDYVTMDLWDQDDNQRDLWHLLRQLKQETTRFKAEIDLLKVKANRWKMPLGF